MRISRKLLEKEVARRLEMEEEFGKEYDNRPVSLSSGFSVGYTRTPFRMISSLG
jgi:hypothetical protein